MNDVKTDIHKTGRLASMLKKNFVPIYCQPVATENLHNQVQYCTVSMGRLSGKIHAMPIPMGVQK